MPFGSESTGDDKGMVPSFADFKVTNAFRQRVHWGLPVDCMKKTNGNMTSPMPFGSESTGDREAVHAVAVGFSAVTNAFRQRVHWGLGRTDRHFCVGDFQVTNAFRQRVHWGQLAVLDKAIMQLGSPMPFGSESTGDSELKEWIYQQAAGVTNAFRQRVHWGPGKLCTTLVPPIRGHQCLSAASPLGTSGGRKAFIGTDCAVTNAFRQRVHWGPAAWDAGLCDLCKVTNAFRQRVHWGRSVQSAD